MQDQLLGSGGWLLLPGRGGADVRVHLGEQEGRLVVVEVRVAASGGVCKEDLRVPIRQVEAAVNLPGIRAGLRDALREQPSESRQPPSPAGVAPGSLRITPTTERKRPDAFYARVTEAYAAALLSTRGPAGAIARASGVPVTTVHRWLKEARRRGLLGPGTPGRAG